MKCWYVARTQPRKEAVARVNLANQGVDTFLPRFRKKLRGFKAFEDKLRPLFPGYIFFLSAEDPATWRSVGGTLGISHIVRGDGRRPRPVPAAFMDDLLDACVDGVLAVGADLVDVGARVQVNRGPFSGQLGTVSTLDDAGRIALFLDVMGGVTARMNIADVERTI